MIACRVHHTKTALMLLCFGADHTHQNEFLETAFDLAIAVDPEREKEFALNFDRELGNEFGSHSTYGAAASSMEQMYLKPRMGVTRMGGFFTQDNIVEESNVGATQTPSAVRRKKRRYNTRRTSGAQDPRKTAITQNLKTVTKAMT